MSGPADSVDWYSELRAGRGDAAQLDPALREALIVATADTAADQGRQLVAEQKAVEAARAESERASRSQQKQWRRRLSVAIVGAAFRLLPGRLVVGAVLVIFTPMGASFATVSPAGDNIRDVVFFAGETGSTAGSGPFTLYSILLRLTIGAIAAMFALDLVFGPPRSASLSPLTVVGALVGVALFILLWVQNALSGASWAIAPALVVVGYLAACLRSGARRQVGPRPDVTATQLAQR